MVSAGSSLLDGLCPYVNDTSTLEEALRCACQDDKDAIYNELWHACAGPQVKIPTIGEKVFYFPQGHLEQVEAHTSHEHTPDLPAYHLPYKIPCTVIHVQLKAEIDTDEVFAQVTLLPETKDKKHVLPRGLLPPVPQRTKVCFFSKVVTVSDTSTHGGFSVHRRHAEECFPPLNMITKDPPAQELVAKDLHGFEWHFRHIYRGAPKRHLLSSGWSTFVGAKKMEPGDTFIFLKAGNGEYRVGVRRSRRSRLNPTISILSSRSMQLGVLATAHHAITTGTMFSVYYRPKTTPSEFIIPHDQYMMSIASNFSPGITFRLKIEDDECPEESRVGAIANVEEIDPVKWPGSKWKCLKVHWSGPCAIMRPERISPWNLEQLAPTNDSSNSHPSLQKRFRTPRYRSAPMVSQGAASFSGLVESSTTCQGPLQVLQGQETSNDCAPKSGNDQELSFSQWASSSNSDSIRSQRRKLKSYPPVGGCSLEPDIGQSLHLSCFQETKGHIPSLVEVSTSNDPQYDNTACMVFGVNLFNNSTDTALVPSDLCHQPLAALQTGTEFTQLSKHKNNGSGSASVKKCERCSAATPSCIKVHKHGNAIGRVVDLTKLSGYEELICELDQMFEFNGALIEKNSDWRVTYSDDDGDIILVGDSTWMAFLSLVRKLLICPKEHAEKQ